MAFGDAAAIAMVEGPFSVPVVFGAGTTRGLYSETESVADFGGFTSAVQQMTTDGLDVSERRVFVFCYAGRFDTGGVLATLAEDSPITVDGRSYYARRYGPTEDGRIYRITLAAA